MSTPDQTVHEVAEEFRCNKQKIYALAREHRIGYNLKGKAGWRFTAADKDALREAMRPVETVTPRRRRRSA